MLEEDEVQNENLVAARDCLFVSGEDWRNNAVLASDSDKWDFYIEGYKRAAEILAEQVQVERFSLDYLVYPILFLYRQYLELEMKYLIRNGGQLLGEDTAFPKDHDISGLWVLCRQILTRIWPDGSENDLEEVGRLIKEFSRTDSRSMAFRYPEDKKGNFFLGSISHINIRNVKEIMARLARLLGGSQLGVTELLAVKKESAAEYGDFDNW